MKYLFVALGLLMGFYSCTMDEKEGAAESIVYDLFQSSDYSYQGKAEIRNLVNGEVEVVLTLDGPGSESPYFFTSHLHFGAYDASGAEIAHVLNPIDIRTLESRTILGQLSDGTQLTFGDIPSFDGHIKVHLADEGPDYNVILVSGNIGSNDSSLGGFNKNKMTLCSPFFPK
ncbi:MAG: hypothetical protein WDZ72_01045 [Cyclobacteriaceae bacterium]